MERIFTKEKKIKSLLSKHQIFDSLIQQRKKNISIDDLEINDLNKFIDYELVINDLNKCIALDPNYEDAYFERYNAKNILSERFSKEEIESDFEKYKSIRFTRINTENRETKIKERYQKIWY